MFAITLVKVTLAMLATTTITTQAQRMETIEVTTAVGRQYNGVVTFHNNRVTNTCNYRVGAMTRIDRPQDVLVSITPQDPRSHLLRGATVSISLTTPVLYAAQPSSQCYGRWSTSANIPAGYTCTIYNCQNPSDYRRRINTCAAHLRCVPPAPAAPSVTIRIADAAEDDPVVDVVPVQVVAADVPGTDPVQYADDGIQEVYGIVDGGGRVVGVAYE
ncbi:hypothetical protein HDV00_005892 [Rhizophlyctis rosea]|nr:hypothetical protein HDV00_005892 [Rhizophlyctis rosea]